MRETNQTDNQPKGILDRLPTVVVVLGWALFGAMWVLVILSFAQQDTTTNAGWDLAYKATSLAKEALSQRDEALSKLDQYHASSQVLVSSALAGLDVESFMIMYCSDRFPSDPLCSGYVEAIGVISKYRYNYNIPNSLPEKLRLQIKAFQIERGGTNEMLAQGWRDQNRLLWDSGTGGLNDLRERLTALTFPELLTPSATQSPTPTPRPVGNQDFARQNPEQSR